MAARRKKVKKRATAPRREKLVRKSKSAGPKSGKTKSGKTKSGKTKSRKSNSGIASLKSQLRAAQDRQTASAEILRAIASAPGEAERALQQIAETSARLFGAASVTIRLVEGDEWG